MFSLASAQSKQLLTILEWKHFPKLSKLAASFAVTPAALGTALKNITGLHNVRVRIEWAIGRHSGDCF